MNVRTNILIDTGFERGAEHLAFRNSLFTFLEGFTSPSAIAYPFSRNAS